MDENLEACQEFLAANEISFLTLRDAARNTSDACGMFRFPETCIINREGRLARKVIGAVDWTSSQMIEYFDGLLAQSESWFPLLPAGNRLGFRYRIRPLLV